MKLFIGFFLSTSLVFAQQKPPRLIIRGDDMGYTILRCYKEGIETSIEVIVPSPWFPEAVKMLAENQAIDVGIHLALSSEWDNIKWRPVSNCPSLRDADGYFYPMIFPSKNYPKRSLVEHDWQLAEIEKEFRAQIELALKKIPRISHFSAHMGCTDMGSEVKALVKKLAIDYHLDIIPEELGVLNVSYRGDHITPAEKIDSFISMLESLEMNKTYLFVDHPGLDTPEMRAIHHSGNEGVALDRQGVTDTWTSPRVRDVIKARGIQLISYKDLTK